MMGSSHPRWSANAYEYCTNRVSTKPSTTKPNESPGLSRYGENGSPLTPHAADVSAVMRYEHVDGSCGVCGWVGVGG